MLIVVNFHYIREAFEFRYSGIKGVTPKEFSLQLDELSRIGDFIDQAQLIDMIKSGKETDSVKLLITFDDGLREQYYYALPILERKGVPAIFYINTSNFAEKTNSLVHKIHLLRSYVSANDIFHQISQKLGVDTSSLLKDNEFTEAIFHYRYDDELDAKLKYFLNFKLTTASLAKLVDDLFYHFESAVEEKLDYFYFDEKMIHNLSQLNALGSHSHDHVPLAKMDRIDIVNQFLKPQEYALSIGIPPFQSISYPYGSKETVSTEVFEVASNAGYLFGLSMERAANISLSHNPLCLARFACNDVPGGKKPIFSSKEQLMQLPIRSWY
ncbi:hypothetical protein MASR2M41_14430 [Flammeovirgaceae bacterium]